ncbi:mandelate racemase/muconate lactonizing enzyme family protein [Psychromarinibacter halotolerans]|uniref:Mandelate racemase/muconate lactonizing enzyme family protein n=1 Tax=Psychromarinibacter halotolerans TaxID=1775175 RepID=A0ABV7GW58_9RHOB|nr:mandelate racemase/muconate lactonizing enzyme family protein [Psychromarinibacter halotolerans]MDF0595265.1 mandelate racemase/muconate lactonizing enzyme family protein [Psychromarinibacter halotolerans]
MTVATIADLRCRVLRISDKTEWTFIELVCSDGVTGIGEASVNGGGAVLKAHANSLAERLRGKPALPNNVPVLSEPPQGGLLQNAVASATEQALWDAQGHRLGQPVTALLGGARRDRVAAYANINRRTRDRTPEGFADSARLARDAGFTHVKIAPFDGVGDGDRMTEGGRVAAGLDCIAAVCAEMDDGARVLVDCHWRFDEPTAFRVLAAAAEMELFWLECPVPEAPAHNRVLRALKQEAARRGVRMAGLEGCLNLAEMRPHIEGGHYDVLMPDVKYIGGLGTTRAVAELAATAGQHVAPHNPTGPVCHAASVAVSATLANFLTLEVQFDESPHFDGLVRCGLMVEDGTLPVSSAPGLGVALDADLVRELEIP